jgi:hypothetical protein
MWEKIQSKLYTFSFSNHNRGEKYPFNLEEAISLFNRGCKASE